MSTKPNSPRVLFVLPTLGRNGAVDLISDLADALARLDVEVELLAIKYVRQPSRLPNESVRVTLPSGEGWFFRFRIVRGFLGVIQLMRSALRSDVLVITWEFGPAMRWTGRIAFLLRKPTVAIVQNNIQYSLADYSKYSDDRALRWAYGKSEKIVCVSEGLIDGVERLADREKIISIRNGVDVERIRSLSKLPPQSSLETSEIPFMVGLGRLAPQKGFDLLIMAHAAVVERGLRHQLMLIGDGPAKSELVKLAGDLGVADSVAFLGYLENPYPVLARASLFCSSSRYDGLSLALLEASVLGVPTIATDCVAGPREVLSDGLYGDLVLNESVEGLSDAIESFFRDPRRLREKAEASVRRAHDCSIQRSALQYRDVLRDCVTPGAGE